MTYPSCKVLLFEWEEECSMTCPGSYTVMGDYYEIKYEALIPSKVEERIAKEESLEALYNWLENCIGYIQDLG